MGRRVRGNRSTDAVMNCWRPLLLLSLLPALACAPAVRLAPVGAAAASGFRNSDDSVLASVLDSSGMSVVRGPVTVLAPADSIAPARLVALADTLARGYGQLDGLLRPAESWHRRDHPAIRVYLGHRPSGALTDAGSRIFFPLQWTETSGVTLLHEMAHVFLMPARPLAFEVDDSAMVMHLLGSRAFWFDEGMAEYAASTVGEQLGMPERDPWGTDYRQGLDAACVAWRAAAGGREAFRHVGQPGPPLLRSRAEIGAFYVCSHSFVAYLVDQIGLTTTLSLGASDDVDGRLRQATHRSLEEWLHQWTNSLPRH